MAHEEEFVSQSNINYKCINKKRLFFQRKKKVKKKLSLAGVECWITQE